MEKKIATQQTSTMIPSYT